MTKQLFRSDYVAGTGAAIAGLALIIAAGKSCYNTHRSVQSPPAPIARNAPIVEGPHQNDHIVDRRFGEESPRSPNFDLSSAGYCGDGVVQTASTTRNALSGLVVVGQITGNSNSTTKAPDTQVTSYNSGRTETPDGLNNTEVCQIDTAMRGNTVCDRNTGDYEQRPTLALRTYPMWVKSTPDNSYQIVLPSFEDRSGHFITIYPIDESAKYLNADGFPAVGATTMPSGGRENPFYAPQDCQPAPVRIVIAAPREHTPSCSPSLLTDRIYRQIEQYLAGVIADQRQAWVQNTDGTYRTSFVLRSRSGDLSASSPSCSGPAPCRLNISPVNDALSSITGLSEDLTCVFTMGN